MLWAAAIPLLPLAGALLALALPSKRAASGLTILSVFASFILSCRLLIGLASGEAGPPIQLHLYDWAPFGGSGIHFEVGLMFDRLSALMAVIVTSVSLAVHIYSLAYMRTDPGYRRFFCYISLFTFAMLMMVLANNLLLLFFGWEGIGLISYLLIGFWFHKPSAANAGLKAFLVNRIGDFGLILGLAGISVAFGSLHYADIFSNLDQISSERMELLGESVSVATLLCLSLFVGAMGKSAQIPLHIWLPDSMEGPTPISALIHAATMVTAGIFMVARMSPLFELSTTALTLILWVGASTALLMGLIGLVQQDIKRIVAYSTLSQLGYMTAGLGVSAYAASIFHLGTHAFFKALLFLAAGSVIMALHHKQDIRAMGGLRKYMPWTYATSLIATLALVGVPFFSGFYSKDSLVEAVGHSTIAGSGLAHYVLLFGIFITSCYSFRLLFVVFHGKSRVDPADLEHLQENPISVTGPLVFLAIPSIFLGFFLVEPLLFGHWFGSAIDPLAANDSISRIHFSGPFGFALHGLITPAFLLILAGALWAWFFYVRAPDLRAAVTARLSWIRWALLHKLGFDAFADFVVTANVRRLSAWLGNSIDLFFIDMCLVNGSARLTYGLSRLSRRLQSGYLYVYAFAMVGGILVLLAALLWQL